MDTDDISLTIESNTSSIDEDSLEWMKKKKKAITKLKRKKRERKEGRTKFKRKSKKRKARYSADIDEDDDYEHEHQLSWLEKMRNIFPKQPLYAWSSMIVLSGAIFGIISYIMPWLTGDTCCIVTGENAPKMDTKIHSYQVYETRILVFIQIVISLVFLLLITKTASLPNNHQSKTPKILRYSFIIYAVAVYFTSLQSGNIDKLITDHAQKEYVSWSNISCPDTRFVINAEFTTWKQMFTASISLTIAASIIAIFRSVFISQTAKMC